MLHNTTQHIRQRLTLFFFCLSSLFMGGKLHAQCPIQQFEGAETIIYGTRMHGQIFTPFSLTAGDWCASNGHTITFQHGFDPIQTKYSANTNISGYGMVNGSYKYSFGASGGGSDILKFKFKNNTDPLNGVNTWDLYLILQHIANVPSFILTNPYQKMAADVSMPVTLPSSPPYSVINAQDFSQLRKLILGTYTNFNQIDSRVDSWRFVPLNRFYNNQANLEPFIADPFSVILAAPYPNYLNQDAFGTFAGSPLVDYLFRASAVAFKMGDINFESSQFACETAKNSSDDRNVISQVASTGQNIVTIPAKSSIKIRLNAENISDIVAWQAGIEYDSERIKITDIQSSTFDQFDEQVWRVDENSVRIAWVNERNQSTTIKDPDTFIEITAETSKDILSDEMLIWFDHEILPFLVFDSKGEVLPVQFEYEIIADEDAGNRESLVASASPNPFTDYVSFQIPELNTIDAQVQLSTLNGSLILDQTVQFEKGTAKLRSSDLLTLPGGIYTATILSKSGVTYHVKLIK